MVNSWRKYICLFFLFVVFDCWMSWNSPRRQEICEWHDCCCCMNRISSLFFLSKTNVPFLYFISFDFAVPPDWSPTRDINQNSSENQRHWVNRLILFLLIITAGEDSPINKISLTTPWAIFRYARSHNSASSWWFIEAISRIKLIKSSSIGCHISDNIEMTCHFGLVWRSIRRLIVFSFLTKFCVVLLIITLHEIASGLGARRISLRFYFHIT